MNEQQAAGDFDARELDALLDAVGNCCLDDARRARLAEILAASDDACRRYVEVMHLCIGISYLSGIGPVAGETADRSATSGGQNLAIPFPNLEMSPESSFGFPAPPAAPRDLSSAPMVGWLLGWRGIGMAAFMVLITSVMLVFFGRREVEIADPPVQAAGENPSLAAFDARMLRIDSGSAKITLPKVGYMLIDGPAEVDLVNPLRAKLNRGRIRVRVTEPTGQGFVVETPDGEIVDLGTEFALNVADGKKTGVVVFDGKVDLYVKQATSAEPSPGQRLVGGEGVTFDKSGDLNRIVSITTGQVATFQPDDESANSASAGSASAPVISKIGDSLRNSETKKFYEIVPGGFRKDAMAYVDRTYEWKQFNGKEGTMSYLDGADYVKMFNDDKLLKDIKIQLTLSQPAKLYVLFDNRVEVPDWLRKDYRKLKDSLELIGYRGDDRIYCRFNVWERVVPESGIITLGPCNAGQAQQRDTSMYVIAAVPLKAAKPAKSNPKNKTVEVRTTKNAVAMHH